MQYSMGTMQWDVFMTRIADLLFPLRCIGCGTQRVALCDACIAAAPRAPAACPGCGAPIRFGAPCTRCRARTHLDALSAPWRFDGIAASAVRALKYRNARDIAAVLGDVLTRSCPSQYLVSNPLLVAVPMHPTRLKSRGTNHAALIADRVTARTLMENAHHALARVRATSAQAKMHHRAERLDNMRGAFACPDASVVHDRDIVLIDDVYTTGATLQDCARALKEAGARHVFGLVVARD